MRTLLAAALVAVLTAAVAAPALAQTNPNQLINQRKGAMNLQAKYAGPIFAMVRGAAAFDARIVQRNADYLVTLSQMPWDDFQPSTTGNTNTKAKEEIYKGADKFQAAGRHAADRFPEARHRGALGRCGRHQVGGAGHGPHLQLLPRELRYFRIPLPR
jgi:cytochrome c556